MRPFILYDRIAAKKPAFFLHLGDTAYTDWPRSEFHPSLAHYRFKHREVRADGHLQDFLARFPTYAVWDDHEVQNSFDRTHPHIAEGRQAFREYWPLVSAGERILYRRFSWTPAADFLLLECRSHRSPRDEAEGPAKTMLGAAQKAWLKEMLSASRAPFKFIISSVPFSGPFGKDRWQGYATERDEIRAFIRDQNIKGVIILSADVHLAIDIHRPVGISEFVAGPIAARTACQMRFFARIRLMASGRFYICDEPNYGLIEVHPESDPPVAELKFLGMDNRVRHRVTIDASR
jgi:phosphodiesterase/alkaline phosphatase D-like protein